jgi:hypothetical protein
MLPRQRVKTVTHVVELPNFVQDRIRMHGVHGFPESLRRKNFRWADLVQATLKRVRWFVSRGELPHECRKWIKQHGHAFIL